MKRLLVAAVVALASCLPSRVTSTAEVVAESASYEAELKACRPKDNPIPCAEYLSCAQAVAKRHGRTLRWRC